MSSEIRQLARTLINLKIPVKGASAYALQTTLPAKQVLAILSAADWVVVKTTAASAPKERTFTVMQNQGPGPSARGGASYILANRQEQFEGMAIQVEDGAPVRLSLAPWRDSYMAGVVGASARLEVAAQIRALADRLSSRKKT